MCRYLFGPFAVWNLIWWNPNIQFIAESIEKTTQSEKCVNISHTLNLNRISILPSDHILYNQWIRLPIEYFHFIWFACFAFLLKLTRSWRHPSESIAHIETRTHTQPEGRTLFSRQRAHFAQILNWKYTGFFSRTAEAMESTVAQWRGRHWQSGESIDLNVKCGIGRCYARTNCGGSSCSHVEIDDAPHVPYLCTRHKVPLIEWNSCETSKCHITLPEVYRLNTFMAEIFADTRTVAHVAARASTNICFGCDAGRHRCRRRRHRQKFIFTVTE